MVRPRMDVPRAKEERGSPRSLRASAGDTAGEWRGPSRHGRPTWLKAQYGKPIWRAMTGRLKRPLDAKSALAIALLSMLVAACTLPPDPTPLAPLPTATALPSPTQAAATDNPSPPTPTPVVPDRSSAGRFTYATGFSRNNHRSSNHVRHSGSRFGTHVRSCPRAAG